MARNHGSMCVSAMYPDALDTHTQPKGICKTNCLLPCICFLVYSKKLVMSRQIHFITHLRALTCSLKTSSECSNICSWCLFTSSRLKPPMGALKQIPWWSALGLTSSGPLPSSSPALAGPRRPQAPGRLLGHRVGVLGELLDGRHSSQLTLCQRQCAVIKM